MFKRMSVLILASLISAGALVGCGMTNENEGGAAERTASNAGRAVDDSVITGKVKAALVADPTTKAHQIEVETFQGRVQLSGFVESTEARSRAVEIAKNVEGVKDVKNSLQLRKTG
jgi:osmotically-inducible protein OsmY